MRALKALKEQQPGFTLVELVVSMAILVMASSMALSVLLAVQAGSKQAGGWGERSQVLRAAMNQIADDLSYATGDGNSGTLGACCEGIFPTQFSVYVYESRTNKTGWNTGWTNAGWQGWIATARTFWVTYRIQDGSLIRIVHDPGDPDTARIYVQQVLATDLDPARSELTVDSPTNTISVILSTVETGGVPRAEVSGVWHIRKIRK